MKYHLELDIDFKRNTHKGKFIVIEGIDGAGKTSQVLDLVQTLSKKYNVVQMKQPSDGPIGVFIRKALAGSIPIPLTSLQYLFTADRKAQQEEIIKHLKKGKTVVMDRYFWSALAYGMADWTEEHDERTGNLLLVALSILSMYDQYILPDKTIYLDISVREARERLKYSKKKIPEVYETEEKLKRIKECYEWLLDKFKNEIVTVNGEQPKEKVTKEILSHIEPLLKK